MSAMPDKTLSQRQLCDLELLLNGGFAPLEGYLGREDHAAGLETWRLADGRLWPVPTSLLLTDEERRSIGFADRVTLRDAMGRPVAEVEIEAIDPLDIEHYARALLGTADPGHPYMSHRRDTGLIWRLGGRTVELEGVRHERFAHLIRDPGETRRMLARTGWRRVVAFQTRNPLHRSHFHMTERALAEAGPDAGLLLHPVIGPTQPGDVDPSLRVACYERILHRYPEGRACLAILPLAMRMLGPREAVWHALIRHTFGATHFIVGRDHAGPSARRGNGEPFFEPLAAKTAVAAHAAEIGITPILSGEIAWYPSLGRYLPVDEAPAGAVAEALSGTRQRALLAAGEPLPSWFTFPGDCSDPRPRTRCTRPCSLKESPMPLISLDDSPTRNECPFLSPDAARAARQPAALELLNDADARDVVDLLPLVTTIRIGFPNFADGRGFSLGRRLRDLGFRGRLRAAGWLLPDQKGHASACGFNEIEIDDALLGRHGVEAWGACPAEPPYRLRRSRVSHAARSALGGAV